MRTILCLLALVISTTVAAAGDNWPEFRGPYGDGHADAKGLPTKWSEKENVKWKTAIHDKGWSSPVIWGDQVWLTTAKEDGKQGFALCLDRKTGKIVHDIKIFEVDKPPYTTIAFNSHASPTPAIEEGKVYIHFGCNATVCLDTSNGKEIWARRDLKCEHWRGPGSSPILYKDVLIAQFDGYDVQYIIALDKKTGKTVWKKDRSIDYGTDNGDLKKAYSTPRVIEVDGKAQLISPFAMGTIAYDPLTGKELWHVMQGGMNVAARPLFGLGRVFLSTGDGGFHLFAVRPDGHDDVTKTHIDWKYNKEVPVRCSLLLIDGNLYMINEIGIVSCVDASTGSRIWKDKVKGNFSSSPIYADSRIYVCSQEGTTYVINPGKKFDLVAANELDDGFMASPAVAGKALYLRTKKALYCIEEK